MPKKLPHKTRIELSNSMLDVLLKLSDGNPGALNVCMSLLTDKHDPYNFAGGFGNLMSLDMHGIYGSNIWVLFKDVCNQNILNVVTVLRAVQLGIYSETDLWNCIDNCILLDCNTLFDRIKIQLPQFGNVNATEAQCEIDDE